MAGILHSWPPLSTCSQRGSGTEGFLVTAWHSLILAFPGTAAHPELQILPQSWGQPRVSPQSCCPPHPRGAGQKGSLTIMFSRAYLASQQFRNTGMNKFRKGGQNIYKSKGYSQKNPCSFEK